jgi:SAM-dependent methyltransferase
MYHPLFTNIENKRVLDLGFGNGKAALYFAQKNKVVAIEKNPRLIRGLQKHNHPNIHIVQANVCEFCLKIEKEEEKFDLIMARNILPFLENKKTIAAILKQLQQALKPGGFVFLTFFGRKDEWFGTRDNIVFLSKKEIEEMLSSSSYQHGPNILEKIYEAEERGVKPTMHNTLKYWHIYNFIFQRPHHESARA